MTKRKIKDLPSLTSADEIDVIPIVDVDEPVLENQTKKISVGSLLSGLGSNSPLTAKGDIYIHDGNNDKRLAVGVDGFVLTSDSTESNGLRWAEIQSGGEPYVEINSEEDLPQALGVDSIVIGPRSNVDADSEKSIALGYENVIINSRSAINLGSESSINNSGLSYTPYNNINVGRANQVSDSSGVATTGTFLNITRSFNSHLYGENNNITDCNQSYGLGIYNNITDSLSAATIGSGNRITDSNYSNIVGIDCRITNSRQTVLFGNYCEIENSVSNICIGHNLSIESTTTEEKSRNTLSIGYHNQSEDQDRGISVGSFINSDNSNHSVGIGNFMNINSAPNSVCIGYLTNNSSEYGVAIGPSSRAGGTIESVGIGFFAQCDASKSVQLGYGQNTTPETLQFRNVTLANSEGIQAPIVTGNNLGSPPSGSIYVDNTSGSERICVYLNGGWKCANLT